ncbi:MAG: acyl-CoA dehydrogenase family protein [Acidimicrobiales bacterium]|jgi:alkylation response protein AidB-like acyl-CoA dehydrogenase|nr:acyl-CoA dehydrogenase family protein [Acidimicrobiales bacterium]
MLNLDFTEEQDMLRDMVCGVCEQLSPLEKVREMEDDADGIARELWQQFGELGVNGLMIAEEYGGSGMTMIEGVVIYEELGRSLAPVPHFVSCVLAAGALTTAGSDEQKSALLPAIASGETIITPAWLEPGNGYSPKGVQLTAAVDGDDVVLNGSKMHVYFAQAADQLLVLARTGDAPTDVDLFLVPTDTAGITLEQRMSISSDTQYRVEFADACVPVANRIGDAGTGWATWDAVMHEAVILASAQAMGGADFALGITAEYSKDRKQFDKALAEFQAISHDLADARTELDGGKLLVYEAAWAHSKGHDLARLAPMAKLFTSKVYRDITAMAQQIFGGVGFTLDYDIQLYFRRAKQLQLSWWDTATCEERVADQVLA